MRLRERHGFFGIPRSTAGLNLTETAIILAIAGLLLGGVWVAVGWMRTNNQIRMAVQELAAVSENIRAVFAEQGGIVDITNGGLTQAMDQLKVFPIDMRDNGGVAAGILYNPFSQRQFTIPPVGGTITVGSVFVIPDGCSATPNYFSAKGLPCFSIVFLSVPQTACINLITQISQTWNTGLQAISTNFTSTPVIAGIAGGTPPLPVSASSAEAACNNANGSGSNDIGWTYLVRESQ